MKSIAYYEADIQEFLMANEEAVLGALAMRHGFALEYQQKLAWQGQIQLLRRFLPKSIIGWIYFEFTIPRMGNLCVDSLRQLKKLAQTYRNHYALFFAA